MVPARAGSWCRFIDYSSSAATNGIAGSKYLANRRVAQGSFGIAADQSVELCLRAPTGDLHVEARNRPIDHDSAACDNDVTHITSRGTDQQRLDRIDGHADTVLAEIEHDDVGLSARHQPAKVRSAQCIGTADGCRVEHILRPGGGSITIHCPAQHQPELEVQHHIRRPRVGAHTNPQTASAIACETLQRAATTSRNQRTMYDGGTRCSDYLQVTARPIDPARTRYPDTVRQ